MNNYRDQLWGRHCLHLQLLFAQRNLKHILDSAWLKPTHFYEYLDNAFVIWPHGHEELQAFFQHLNPNIIPFILPWKRKQMLKFLCQMHLYHGNQMCLCVIGCTENVPTLIDKLPSCNFSSLPSRKASHTQHTFPQSKEGLWIISWRRNTPNRHT